MRTATSLWKFRLQGDCVSAATEEDSSKFLKGQLRPRVGHVTFLDHQGGIPQAIRAERRSYEQDVENQRSSLGPPFVEWNKGIPPLDITSVQENWLWCNRSLIMCISFDRYTISICMHNSHNFFWNVGNLWDQDFNSKKEKVLLEAQTTIVGLQK